MDGESNWVLAAVDIRDLALEVFVGRIVGEGDTIPGLRGVPRVLPQRTLALWSPL